MGMDSGELDGFQDLFRVGLIQEIPHRHGIAVEAERLEPDGA
jgi:hypothetical protein